MRTFIGDLSEKVGQTITIQGWIVTVRRQKRMQFAVVRDHTGHVQVVNNRELDDTLITEAFGVVTEQSAVEITGTVEANAQVKLGGIEITPSVVTVVNQSRAPLPIDSTSSLDLRMDWRFLDLRSDKGYWILKVQTLAEHAMRLFWQSHGFVEIHSPKFMGSASESGAELFRVDYFGRSAYLAQSPQFYKQMAMAAGLDRVFEIGPVFRANPSFTSRHDTEFTSVDVELSWIRSHEDVMRLEEDWLQFVLSYVKEHCGAQLSQIFGVEVVVPSTPFPRLTMGEAYRVLAAEGYDVPRTSQGDLDPEGERRLSRYIQNKFDHEFVFVTEYPTSVRPFYHMRGNSGKITRSFDLIWRGLEVTTGAQREHRYDVLERQVIEKGLNPETIKSYLDCFRFGMPPHGGFGFGLTRMLMTILGYSNVREVTYLYRGPNRLSP